MRAAIYARVSGAKQREAHTIESQLAVLRPLVAAQGWELVGEYIDDGRSAKTGMLEKREGFARLVADATARRFDVVVVLLIDRLARTEDMTERARILAPFQRAGVRIVTPQGEFDLRTMLGELYVTLGAIFGAEENRVRAARIKSGKLRALAEGRKPAGPTPFGLAYDRALGQWSIDEAAAAVVREIVERVARGESCQVIAADLDARAVVAPRTGWSRSAVHRIVRSRSICGEWVADKARGAVIAVPRIVSDEQWLAADRELRAHKLRGLRKTKHVYLLEGLAVCACGAPIMIRSASRSPARPTQRARVSSPAYVCRARKLGERPWRYAPSPCTEPVLRTADVDAAVWAAVVDELQRENLAARIVDRAGERTAEARDWEADAAGYRAHLVRLDRVESSVLARFRRGTISDAALDAELAALGRERAAVREQVATAEQARAAAVAGSDGSLDALRSRLSHLHEMLLSASPDWRRAFVRALIQPGGVRIAGGVVEIAVNLGARSRELDSSAPRPWAAAERVTVRHALGATGGRSR